uniref:Uncharacterized protein n=1 Tax=Meloidogyne enterolobii TaxID=390850 RepID=A0A6V7WHH5_MELEN|nr:unnamed protein product [Meloidogyne enterolobii]
MLFYRKWVLYSLVEKQMNYNTECCVGTSSSSSFSEERLNKNINSVEVEQNQSCSLTTGVLNEENNGGGIHSNKNNLPVVGGSGRENTESQIDKLQQNQSCSSASNPGVLNDESNGGGTPVIFLTCEYIGVGGGDRNMEDESMEQLQQNQSGSPSEGENACSQVQLQQNQYCSSESSHIVLNGENNRGVCSNNNQSNVGRTNGGENICNQVQLQQKQPCSSSSLHIDLNGGRGF